MIVGLISIIWHRVFTLWYGRPTKRLLSLLLLSVLLHDFARGFIASPRAGTRDSSSMTKVHRLPLKALDATTSSWEHGPLVSSRPYMSKMLMGDPTLQKQLLDSLEQLDSQTIIETDESTFDFADFPYEPIYNPENDPLWIQIKLEAKHTIEIEPSSGPQLFTNILSQPSLLGAITSIVSHEIATQLIPATSLQNLFLEMLHPVKDAKAISLDIMASAMRSPSSVDGTALHAILFNQGLHALVCHRLAHRLWEKKRTGLAYYIQSTVSRKFSTDIHPAARFGSGIFLNAGSAGVVIGETAIVDNDVTILQGVTLGGTGKERGDRHPKVKARAILQQSCSVLGNIEVGEGAIITAKSIVTKPVKPYTKVSGVPAKFESNVEIGKISQGSYRDNDVLDNDWRMHPETRELGERIEQLLETHSIFLLNNDAERVQGAASGTP
jgi:Serine acetyltransferase